jgi:uncharacterized protein (DUF849 family)
VWRPKWCHSGLAPEASVQHGGQEVLLKACLNGARRRDEHPAVPLTPAELALDARRVVLAGAGAVHVHPRSPGGNETLDPHACDETVGAIRARCPGIPVSLTTGAWIEPDLDRRLSLIEGWRNPPDWASVNFSEEGAVQVCAALARSGVAVEAGLSSVADAEELVANAVDQSCVRALVEVEGDPSTAVAAAAAIDAALDAAGLTLPRLHHGYGSATWAVIRRAVRLSHDVRVGLEDTLELPDGRTATGNAELVATAAEMVKRSKEVG